MRSNLIARTGLASLPVTAFAPVAGVALTGHGAAWAALPVGSVVAAVVGTCAGRRAASTRRRGVVVSDPPPAAEPDLNVLRDVITVEYRWSDAA